MNADGSITGDAIQVVQLESWFTHIPTHVWIGSEYGIVWQDERSEESFEQIYFTRIDSHGEKEGGDIMLSDPMVTSRNPQVTWTGSEIGAVCANAEMDILIFHRADATGEAIGRDLELAEATSGNGFPTDLVWTGSELGVVWVWTPFDSRNGTYFNRIGFCD